MTVLCWLLLENNRRGGSFDFVALYMYALHRDDVHLLGICHDTEMLTIRDCGYEAQLLPVCKEFSAGAFGLPYR